MLKPRETAVTAKNISAKSRTSHYRFQLQQNKSSNSDIASIESKMAEMANTMNIRSSNYMTIKKYQFYIKVREGMLQFYCHSSWARRKKCGQKRFRNKAYSISAKKIVSNADSETNVVFYGNSDKFIKEYERRSTKVPFQQIRCHFNF